ncbi:UDP-N-acetylmuramate-alanine ligase [Sphaerochaeta pleomorpha str. Grapes]|uniref:UDP-N-acetylmuramate-alanine ligase n=1 Tax=Sphaerochaeta pleomorpha (strain ATCC BAA-1885 / DSM 22778 / Grapes) TaxID=158190 RepID=G8QR37_SPHPG|nr:Mur ligase family protein [Sphaerochaeta pleomorpha]AEV30972.1 UDP-N-acetylmuramate-alanine ligase [Sphaerochaeta pleomorpha str. Grapes]
MNFSAKKVYLVGIKGTGMASLAVLLHKTGANVSGCDSPEIFSTDTLLAENKIPVISGFSISSLPSSTNIVIHSSAYQRTLPILQEAERIGLEIYSYPEFLALLSKESDSYAVAGTHGKTTTTAVASYLLASLGFHDFPFYSIYGSNLQGESSLPYQGSEVALFEACEYQDHFLSYSLRGALVTNVDFDHPDYFHDLAHVQESFEKFVVNIRPNGFLICCNDDPGSKKLAQYCRDRRPDITLMTYGFNDNGPFWITKNHWDGTYSLSCLGGRYFVLPPLSEPLLDDYIGGAVLALAIMLDRPQVKLYLDDSQIISEEAIPSVAGMLTERLVSFPGCVGRSEVMLEEGGITYIDDYAHHPMEIKATIDMLHIKYPKRPLAVLFCPHTASRTKALLKDFVIALSLADKVVIQHSYASARNDTDLSEDPAILLEKALSTHIMRTYRCHLQTVSYAPDDKTAVSIMSVQLQPGDLCITMGAGNNRLLGPEIAQARRSL